MIIAKLLGMFSTDMGIDLGTANTLVCVEGKGIVLAEPSVVAVKKGTSKVLLDGEAVGHRAKDMIGKTPSEIETIRPLKDGVIANFDITRDMLAYFIRKVHGRSIAVKPRIVISVPSGITSVEKKAVVDAAERAGAREVYLIDEPRAAAIGAGLPIQDPVGNMVVDIGGGTTEVAVISLAGCVTSKSVRIAGDAMDAAIVEHMERTYNLHIGPIMAESVKIQIGSAYQMKKELSMEVRGRDSLAGLPRRVIVNSEEIRESIKKPVHEICKLIRDALSETPPEIAADLVDTGIHLAGGGALLRGLPELISQETGLPVRLCDDPLKAVAKGTAVILEHLHILKQILESGDGVKD